MDTTQTEIQRLAKVAAQSFETATRDNGDTYYIITEGSPKWVKDLVHAAHGSEFLPDDYRYKWASEACEFIAESDDPEDGAGEFAESAVDVYTGDLLAWLASNLQRPGYCDEAANEGLIDSRDGEPGIVARVGVGQYMEAAEVYNLVLRFLQDSAEAL